MLESEQVTDEVKATLSQQYATLNPAALLRQMQRLQTMLWKLAAGEPAEPATAQVEAASS